jgi:hypothetical protein
MNYVFVVYDKNGKRKDTTTQLSRTQMFMVIDGAGWIDVFDAHSPNASRLVWAIHTRQHINEFLAVDTDKDVSTENESLLSKFVKGATDADPVNPPHYQGYIQDLQWLEAMQYIPSLRKPERLIAAIELQIRKYLDRNGRKDDSLQEVMKALWYMKFMTAYMKNGGPIRVKDIDSILMR